MDTEKLKKVTQQILADGRGILAADESTSTIGKRFEKINIENNEDNRRAYRELLFTTPHFAEYISGVILYDETFHQCASTGESFISLLKNEGVLPGIKVDEGTQAMEGSPDEKVTKGLEGLPPRLEIYAAEGAAFAKWRAVITIADETLPTDANLRQNARDLATYALMCQNAGIVPIIEPEVLMDGAHSLARCEEVSEKILTYVFEEVAALGVFVEGIILKTNMVVPGSESGELADPVRVADATLRVFKKTLPASLQGQVFLSGGQSEVEATANLNEMNKRGPLPWKLSFSYGRALQDSCLKAWGGAPTNVPAAQEVFLHRAQMNRQAALGTYTGE